MLEVTYRRRKKMSLKLLETFYRMGMPIEFMSSNSIKYYPSEYDDVDVYMIVGRKRGRS